MLSLLCLNPQVDLRNWLLVFCKRDASRAGEFLNMMERCCPQMGVRIQPPTRFELQDDKTQTYLSNIRNAINPELQLVVIIFPTSRDDRYNAVKKLCCVEKAIPSQVIISRTISQQQKLRSVTQKIALQINCKLGGELWSVEIPSVRQLMKLQDMNFELDYPSPCFVLKNNIKLGKFNIVIIFF